MILLKKNYYLKIVNNKIMMYMGSKNRIAKHLLPIILKDRKQGQWYVEPFVGGANMIDKVDGNRVGLDSNQYLISFFNALKSGWLPPNEVTKCFYYEVKNNKDDYPLELVCFVGFLCSFGGKWFGGYAHNKQGYNYAGIGRRSVLKQLEKIQSCKFVHKKYQDLEFNSKCIIYCDPPYEGTTKYKDDFNHSEFWEWARNKSIEGHSIFVSEYNAPKDFKCVKSLEASEKINKNNYSKRVEKLFVYNH